MQRFGSLTFDVAIGGENVVIASRLTDGQELIISHGRLKELLNTLEQCHYNIYGTFASLAVGDEKANPMLKSTTSPEERLLLIDRKLDVVMGFLGINI